MHFGKAIVLVFLAVGMAGCSTQKNTATQWTVRFPEVPLEQHEYIQGIQLKLKNAKVAAMNHFPDDWHTKITWDNPLAQNIEMVAGHFSAGLEDIHRLDGFVTFAAGDADFEVTAVLQAESTIPTGRPGRKIVLRRANLILKRE